MSTWPVEEAWLAHRFHQPGVSKPMFLLAGDGWKLEDARSTSTTAEQFFREEFHDDLKPVENNDSPVHPNPEFPFEDFIWR